MHESDLAATELLPLRPDVLTILLRLLEGDAYGYAFIQAAEERSGRRGHLQPGSLYRLLREMLAAGLVERADDGQAADDDDRRRYYRITSFGRRVAAAESRRMVDLLRVARGLDLLEKGGPA